ncbi:MULTISPECIES: hypothetical protein [Pontibacillus]|uniref:LiaF transmembrane domain-containing protein n=1 Tax=Pontibacillus chungwhensis TaxID=265426 RepID=A0ABY8V434_9BACI|nr:MULTISPECIES: hypothetical protein [Pontibacillus]MCD5322323.1 hypothetical protein [Pontibacillus sp. HN14]WIF99614.1 hypothetical protein QNI29_08140 [Pontibacillus chungwhensis]
MRATGTNTITGLIFVITGIVILLANLGIIPIPSTAEAWPAFILLPAVGFHVGFFLSGRKSELAGLLVPGGILLIISLLFFFETATGFAYSAYTWPVYLLAPAFGLFELWYFGKREKGLLIPVSILTGIAVFSWGEMVASAVGRLWPVIFILIGLYLLFGQRSKKKNDKKSM